MLRKRWVYLLALFSILFLPSLGMTQAIGLAVVDDEGTRVGPVVEFDGIAARVYYVGNPSQSSYFQFKDYIFLGIEPDAISESKIDVYWTLPLCQGDPYVELLFSNFFDSTLTRISIVFLMEGFEVFNPAHDTLPGFFNLQQFFSQASHLSD